MMRRIFTLLTAALGLALTAVLAGLLTTAGAVGAQPQCSISATHETQDRSISSMAGDALTVDEGGNWVLDLTFKCAGITDSSTHDPAIDITGITSDSGNGWSDNMNPRFSGHVWNQDGLGPTGFGGRDPAGDFTARVSLFGTSVDNNCHDTGASTRMQITAEIGNTVTPSDNMAERTITVTARDDDPLTYTAFPGEPYEITIPNWNSPCS